MKNIVITFIMVISITTTAYAVQKYNPMDNKWETTSQDGQLVYNPMENDWSYQQPGSKLEYNAFDNNWEYAPPDCGRSDDGE